MNKKLILVTIILLILLVMVLGLVSASSNLAINDFKILLDGEELSAINLDNALPVTLELTANPFDGIIQLDLRELNPALGDIRLDTTNDQNCVLNEDQIFLICKIDFQLKPINNSPTLRYRFFHGGWTDFEEKTFNFEIDNESPVITDLKTSFCKENNCYLGRGKTNITLAITDNYPLNPSKIFYEIPEINVLRPVNNCSSGECYSLNQSFNCPSTGSHLHLKLASKSTDAAGNHFEDLEEAQKLLICDLDAPKIINFSIKGNGLLQQVTDANTAIIDILVRETTTKVKATIDASRITNNSTNFTADCTRVKGPSAGIYQKCLVEISDLKATTNGYFDIYVEDELGNKASKLNNKIKVLHEESNLSKTIDFFSARVTEVKPKIINRAALDLALENALDYPFHVLYKITNKYPGNAKILLQNLDVGSCRFDFGNGTYVDRPSFFNADHENVFYPEADYDVDNRLDLNFLNPEIDKNKIKVKCNLTLNVEKDNIIYEAPEIEVLSWEINLRNARLGDPGQAFLDKITETKKNLNSGLFKLIGTLNKLFATMQNICHLTNVMLEIQKNGISLEALGALMPYGLGQAMAQSGNAMWNQVAMVTFTQWVGNDLNKKLDKIKGNLAEGQKKINEKGGMFRNMCSFVSCDMSKKTDGIDHGLANTLNLGKDETNPGYFDKLMNSATSNLNQPSPKDSLVTSLLEQCWSGVVYNLNKLREIDCGYIYCLKEQAYYGDSIAVCEEAKSAKTCRFVYGEIFELPFVRVFKNLAANINQLIQEPVIIMAKEWSLGKCQGASKSVNPKGIACHLMHTLGVEKDYSFITQYNQLFTYPTGQDFCEKALCEGEDCDLPTASWIAKALPGTYREGDTYRSWKLSQKEKQENIQDNKGVSDEITTKGNWNGVSNWEVNKSSFPKLQKYFNTNKISPSEQSKIFDTLKNNKDVRADFASGLRNGQTLLTAKEMEQYHNNPFLSSSRAVQQNAVDATTSYNVIMKIPNWNVYNETKLEDCTNDDCRTVVTALKTIKSVGGRIKNGKLCLSKTNCFNSTEASKYASQVIDSQKAKKFYAWFDQVASIIVSQLKQQGYLDSLSLSGWGDWGRELSLKANKLLNPEEWINNLCNPTGKFKDLTSTNDAVYVMEEQGFRPVLTFATEKLTYDLRNRSKQTLYTTNIIVVSPFTDNDAQIFLEPGRFNISTNISLPKETVVTKAFSKISNREFKKVCVEFKKEFPRPGNPKKYCKPIVLNAYDRGNVAADNASQELDFGVEGSPYSHIDLNYGNQTQFPPGTAFGAGFR